MSIYAKNKIVDETTGEEKLVKHLNKDRIDRGRSKVGGWNKTGKKARVKKRSGKGKSKKKFKELKEQLKQIN
jgi:hypothetical protein